MKQLEKRKRMFMAVISIHRKMVRMRMDNRHAVHQVNVGKSEDTSHISNEQSGKYQLQIFTADVLHCLQR